MSDFSDEEDRKLIQLLYQDNAMKGKRISWVNIAAKMRIKKTPNQLRMRVVCLQRRFGNILAHFPRWYFQTAQLQSHNRSKIGGVIAPVRVFATARSVATIMAQSGGGATAAQQLVQKVS